MSVAAALSSVIAPAGPAKGAGKTAGANATDDTAGAVQEIFGLAAGSTKGAAKAGDAKTGDNDDQASSPFADALAAALGVALQPILTQTAVATPKEASTSAVSRDGNAATVPAPAIGGSQTPTTNGTPTASASPTPSTTPTLVTTQAIVAAANDIKLADPKVVTQTPAFTANAPIAAPADADSAAIGATAPSPTPPIAAPADTDSAAIVATTPSPTAPVAAPTGPVSAVQTAQSSAAVTAPSALLVADPTVAPDQVALVPPVPAETAIQTAVAPPKAPLAPHVDKLTASSPPKSKAPASSPDAVKGPVAGVAPSKPDTVETLTDKAVAAVDNANPDAPATPDKVADPSALLANAQAAGPQATIADSPKVTGHTVAHLAAQIASNVEGKSTRFDVTLNPEGLGKVDVRVNIDARGQMTAQLNFASADAASQMQAKAAELHNALQQAGFDPSKTTLSFNSGGAQQGPWQDTQNQNQGQPSWTGRAFTNLSDQSDELAMAPSWTRRASGGVDVRI